MITPYRFPNTSTKDTKCTDRKRKSRRNHHALRSIQSHFPPYTHAPRSPALSSCSLANARWEHFLTPSINTIYKSLNAGINPRVLPTNAREREDAHEESKAQPGAPGIMRTESSMREAQDIRQIRKGQREGSLSTLAHASRPLPPRMYNGRTVGNTSRSPLPAISLTRP